METTNLKMSLGATGVGVTVTVTLDSQTIWTGDPGQGSQELSYDFSDEKSDHTLIITMSGKTEAHTVIDEQGQIAEDLLVSIRDFFLDGIKIDHVIYKNAKYHHDFNGSQEKIVDEFFGDIGCNGYIEFHFSTPAYIWLLENE